VVFEEVDSRKGICTSFKERERERARARERERGREGGRERERERAREEERGRERGRGKTLRVFIFELPHWSLPGVPLSLIKLHLFTSAISLIKNHIFPLAAAGEGRGLRGAISSPPYH
jgi:hypothetical protein